MSPTVSDVIYKFGCPTCRRITTIKQKMITPSDNMDEAKQTSRVAAVGFKCEHCGAPLPNGIDVSVTIEAMESGTLQSLRDRGLLP
jgi:hypothetical protein